MKLGSVLGPFPGSFWIDLESGELVLRQGTHGIVGEVRFQTNGEQRADLLERLLVNPLPMPKPSDPDPPVFQAPIRPVPIPMARSLATTSEGRRAISAARPTHITCGCGKRREVGKRGAIPKRCEDCSPPDGYLTLARSVDNVVAKRGDS